VHLGRPHTSLQIFIKVVVVCADCFFKQDEWEFALADYQQAKEISPDDQVIRIRLAVIHNTLGTHCYQDR
jgi:hypothetical protein